MLGVKDQDGHLAEMRPRQVESDALRIAHSNQLSVDVLESRQIRASGLGPSVERIRCSAVSTAPTLRSCCRGDFVPSQNTFASEGFKAFRHGISAGAVG